LRRTIRQAIYRDCIGQRENLRPVLERLQTRTTFDIHLSRKRLIVLLTPAHKLRTAAGPDTQAVEAFVTCFEESLRASGIAEQVKGEGFIRIRYPAFPTCNHGSAAED
jgi:hypothetical protein